MTSLKCKFDIYPPTKEIFFFFWFEDEFSLWILTSYTYNTVLICMRDCLFVCLFQWQHGGFCYTFLNLYYWWRLEPGWLWNLHIWRSILAFPYTNSTCVIYGGISGSRNSWKANINKNIKESLESREEIQLKNVPCSNSEYESKKIQLRGSFVGRNDSSFSRLKIFK